VTSSVYIIAEAGVNHNGDLTQALELVEHAVQAGADAVKFQTFRAEHLASQSAPKAEYQMRNTDQAETQYEMLRKLELSMPMHLALIERCEKLGIEFLSTAFDIPSIQLLQQLGVKQFKIPSGEITNLPYLKQIGSLGEPVILSTGMSDLGEINAALDVLTSAGQAWETITVLHCNTEYPTPVEDVNLRAMQTIAAAFPGIRVGYSDHTTGIEIPIAAVAMGAVVIEKHFTLDRNMEGPDHKASLEPDELKAMVHGIRKVEMAAGSGIKKPSSSAMKNREIAMKSIVAKRAITASEEFSTDNLTVKRPGHGISPMRWEEVLGKKAKRSFEPDELIEL
jgi:N,N'-diacetyllegionaminate synthase